jgi:hypothetical protein
MKGLSYFCIPEETDWKVEARVFWKQAGMNHNGTPKHFPVLISYVFKCAL